MAAGAGTPLVARLELALKSREMPAGGPARPGGGPSELEPARVWAWAWAWAWAKVSSQVSAQFCHVNGFLQDADMPAKRELRQR